MKAPKDSRVLNAFLQHFKIVPKNSHDKELLYQVISAFAQLPYENLTKILKKNQFTRAEFRRRSPEEVIENHKAWGTGGTCFSLTSALLCLLKGLGWEAEPILADRPYGDNTHSALLIWIDGQAHLVDPGFLILQPTSLINAGEKNVSTKFNQIMLQARDDGAKLDLLTVENGSQKKRLTYKTQVVDENTFLKVWDDSFDWGMMRYPLLSRVIGEEQIYLRKNRLQLRSHKSLKCRELSLESLAESISLEFGISANIVKKALEVLKTHGEFCAKALSRFIYK